jgi:branched-chain amino acid transport system substrate-binding protein
MSNRLKHFAAVAMSAAAFGLVADGPAAAKVEGDTIILGAAVSLTGKYSTNGKNTKDGYDLAVQRVNEMGGVTVGGKSYKIKVVYYDDESTPARGAQLAERLINKDGVQFMLGPYSSGLTKAIAGHREYGVPMVEANSADRGLLAKATSCSRSVDPGHPKEAINLAGNGRRPPGSTRSR